MTSSVVNDTLLFGLVTGAALSAVIIIAMFLGYAALLQLEEKIVQASSPKKPSSGDSAAPQSSEHDTA